ncbi:MAG: cysteine desulfurase NifS [Candidatus Omnitrophota bacterium]
MDRIYLDYAATTPCDPEVIKAMQLYFFKDFANPSSIHYFGRHARQAVEESRKKTADFLGANPDEIIFTSGGTESNNSAIKGIAYALKEKGRHIVTSAVEHHAVSEPCEFLEKNGFKITTVKVDKYGLVDPSEIKKALTNKTILVSVMHANNEIGTIQPIAEIGSILKEKGVCFHVDAVQSAGHIPVNVNELNVDLLSLSAHKFYGPKGVGVLYVRKGLKLENLLHGGNQEKGRRASTSNTAGIVGLAKALELCAVKMAQEADFQSGLRDKIINRIEKEIPESLLNGHREKRLPNNINFSIRYIEGESILLHLDALGIAVSTGSACTSSNSEPSRVLTAIGLPHEIAHGSLRITLGRWTKEKDVDFLLENLPKIVNKLRAMSPLYEK